MYPSLGYGEELHIEGLEPNSIKMDETQDAHHYSNNKYGKLVKPYKLSYTFFPEKMQVTKSSSD